MNASIAPDAAPPLVEFISEAVSLLESDLIMVSTNGTEAEEDITAFKQRYPFAFQTPVAAPTEQEERATQLTGERRRYWISEDAAAAAPALKSLRNLCRKIVKSPLRSWSFSFLKRKSICK